MDFKQAFINWISTNKLKNTTPIDLANNIEVAFNVCFNLDVWQISDPKLYSDLRNKIILDKNFKRKNKKIYKKFVTLGRCYQVFLKNEFITNSVKSMNFNNVDELPTHDSSEGKTLIQSEDENRIYEFFNDNKAAQKFCKVFEYALKEVKDLVLDIRVSIIGVKIVGERLRFYSDKTNLKFSKTNRTFLLANNDDDLDDIFAAVDEVNKYFCDFCDEVVIFKERELSLGYVYHLKFGFGYIMSQEDNIVKIKFDDDSIGIKIIQLNHPTYEKISRQDYERKLVPNGIKEKSSTGRVGWDKFESALLIEAFWKIENKKGNRNEILTKLSNDLRTRAIHLGQKIDDKFRNLNGVNIQLSNIALSFYPERSAMHRTAIFDTIAKIYLNDRNEFDRILSEAHEQVNGTQHNTYVDSKSKKYVISMAEVDFYSYIKDSYIQNHKADGKAHRANNHAQKCIDIVRDINEMLLLSKLKINNIYSISNVNELNQIIAFVKENLKDKSEDKVKWVWYVLNRYKIFLKEEKKKLNSIENMSNPNNEDVITQGFISAEERMRMYPDYVKVLQECFPEGFAYKNQLRKRKFIKCYSELNGKVLEDSNEVYEKKLLMIGFISEEKVYLPSIVDATTYKALKKYIDKKLDATGSIIYYSVIYDSFTDRLNAGFSEGMLKEYLIYIFAGVYKFDREYLSKVGTTGDSKKDLINLFINTGHPMEIEEIYSKLPNIAQNAIDGLLRDRDFIVNFRGKSYFYKGIFEIEDQQLSKIRDFIRETIQEKYHVSSAELCSFIREEMPELIESNPYVTDLGFKNSIKLLLNDEFSFKGDVISESSKQIDVKELYREFCRRREKFTLEELEEFKASIHKSYIDYNAVFEISIRVDADTYVRRDIINFDVEKIDNAILNYCNDKYVSYLDIINFIEFPTLQYPWNYYVLEGYLFSESKIFSILNATFNKEKPVGAIIKKHAFDNFDDLIVDVIKENRLFNREKAFEYLQENCFILTRKFKNIDLLINKAKM
ncbi:MAG: hypothetical protein NC090_03355 [Anaeroplasma bactoclasticum]|nr:hypothetical protein [Anaeroplasma bactoclasticum]